MLFIQVLSIALQVFAAASVLGGAVLWAARALNRERVVLSARGEEPLSGGLRLLSWSVLAAVGSRLLLCALAWLALQHNGVAPSMEHIWSKWDAPHYLDIARYGYTANKALGDQWLFIVFYPLYPLLVAALSPVLGGQFPAATVLSWVFLILACYWLYRLAALDGDGALASRAVKYLLIFPTAVFLGAPYTESLFLLLTILCLYALRRGRWALAGLTGFLAALTRNVGVLLVLPFLVELLDKQRIFAEPKLLLRREFWRAFLRPASWALLIPLGMGVYLFLNWKVYGDPLMFLQIQDQHWGQHAQPFFQSIAVTFQNLFTYDVNTNLYLWAPQFLGMVSVLIALPFLVRRMRPAYGAYLLGYLVIILSPSWLLSFNRYLMGAVPLLLGLAHATRRKWLDTALTLLFLAFMVYLMLGYVSGRMVV